MNIWLPILILSAQSAAPIEHRYAEVLFATGFEQETDSNYDTWPDGWTRRRGLGFPQYVQIGIGADIDPESSQQPCLCIELDGGGGTVFGPAIDINPRFSYLFEGKLKTARLHHNSAYFTVTFYDATRSKKEVHKSPQFVNAPFWEQIQIGPVTPRNADARFAIVGVHLVPGGQADLNGMALFDDIRLSRLPRLSLVTNDDNNLFLAPDQIQVTCTVSGIRQPRPLIQLELLDVTGAQVAIERLHLENSDHLPAEAILPQHPTEDADPGDERPGGYTGALTWQPPVPGYGYFEIRASLCGKSELALQQSVSLAVMRPGEVRRGGEFGWSLGRGEKPLSMERLPELLDKVKASWLKFPIWYGVDETDRADRIAEFADRLSSQGVKMVGMFDDPPSDVRQRFGNKKDLSVAEIFMDPTTWRPAIDPLMVDLSLKIQWWQLGSDDDESFIDFVGLEQRVRDIRSHLRQFGQANRVGFAWRWMHEVPPSVDPPWDFLAMTESPAFTSVELKRYAERAKAGAIPSWTTLWPLPKEQYDVPTRARDLTLRMLAAKTAHADAIFVGNPFDDSRGLLKDDGSPTALFLPWRTTSQMIGGAQLLGSLQLPAGSHNYVFARGTEAVMVVWSENATTETIFLGDNVEVFDLWGRKQPQTNDAQPGDQKQTIRTGRLPVFVTGLDPQLAQWRMHFSFEPAELDCLYERAQTVNLSFRNTLSQGIGGTLTMHFPDVWEVRAPTRQFKMAADEQIEQSCDVLLHTDARSGPQRVRVDFDIAADHPYRFSVYRNIQVGHREVLLEMTTWLDDQGRLVVEQHLINNTSENLSFNCYLFAPERRRIRKQLFDIKPGQVTNKYVLPNGKELLGRTLWLRLEQVGGTRLLNHQVVAEL